MEITPIELNNLKLCPLNVRKHGDVSGEDLKPSIRKKGVQQPLLVRPNCEGYEIVAGQRRYNACKAIASEGDVIEPLPCIIMDEQDDAAVIEASLIENIERLPMDEIDQYQAFAALLAEGRTVADIAAAFGVSEKLVNQRLAISNLYEPILKAYRQDDIRAGDVRLLTMATKRQQKAWWKLFKNEDDYAPLGRQLKQWLFGGAAIPTENALFDLADYKGGVTSDLFGEESYFTQPDVFWQLQSKAIAERKEAYLSEGWADVIITEVGEYWVNWEYAAVAKEDGGKVYVTCTHDGEITFREGLLPTSEVRKREKAEQAGDDAPSVRPELTKALQNYLTLHRHNAVRVEMLGQPALAMRLTVAHMIAGSALWDVKMEPQRADKKATTESVDTSADQATMAAEAAEIRKLLGFEHEKPIVDQGWNGRDVIDVFECLRTLDDTAVLRVVAYVMAVTLSADERVVTHVGELLAVDMRNHWYPDEAFFDLLRDKEAINGIVEELAGEEVAKANLTTTAKGQKIIVRDCLNGTRKAKVQNWLPRYLEFPMRHYTERA